MLLRWLQLGRRFSVLRQLQKSWGCCMTWESTACHFSENCMATPCKLTTIRVAPRSWYCDMARWANCSPTALQGITLV